MSANARVSRFLLPVTAFLLVTSALLGPPTRATRPDAGSEYQLKKIAEGFERPVLVTHAGDARLFVVEQRGTVKVMRDGRVLDAPFLDVRERLTSSGNEQGLLGLAFPPDYAANGRLYIYYTARDNGDIVIERHSRSANNPDVTDPAQAARVLRFEHGNRSNHNGGGLAFGPDGLLYIGSGDGGGAGDPYCAGQNLRDLRGKLLRIDVRGQETYVAPAANVFDPAQAPEVYAIGLRNPWRFSFDRANGDIWIGDVGQNAQEEIDRIPANAPAGLNFGWSQREGTLAYADRCADSGRPRVEPVLNYGRSAGQSVTGGYVYRGKQFPSLQGSYFYADYASRQVWRASVEGSGYATVPAFGAPFNVSSFGEDVAGELYLVDLGGAIHRLELKGRPAVSLRSLVR